MVELDQVSYWYPASDAPALDRVDLSLGRGDRLLVAGLSGAGKSTLLRVLNGLVPHFYGGRFAGQAHVAGLDLRRVGPARLAGHVSMVFQEPETRFVATHAEDEIAFGLEVAGVEAKELRRRVGEVIERFELGRLLDRPLEHHSAGEQSRVAVAAALSRRPDLLVLDEPTTELDPVAAQALVEWMDELARTRELGFVVAEHRLGRWLGRVDRLGYLEAAGRLTSCGDPERVVATMPYGDPVEEARRRLRVDPGSGVVELTKVIPTGREPRKRSAVPGGVRLSARGVGVSYNGRVVLDDVSVEMRAGEVVGLVGKNGCGKTTLLRCLMGLIPSARGEVRMDGASLDGRPVAERAQRIGFVSQTPGSMLFADTVEAELETTLAHHGMAHRPPVDPDWLLERLGLDGVRHHYPRDISAGQRQRTALAAVLVTRPSVLLLDEPTLGMDPPAQSDLGRLLREWASEGAAVLVTSHDVEFLAAHADRVIALEAGWVAADGPTAETLFAFPGFRTSLQSLTGRAWPACPEDIPPQPE
jgi:energy-coupling factor transport system ATP-binding protein